MPGAEVFGNRIVFAVTCSLAEHFQWRGPVVGFSPDLHRVAELDAPVQELVDQFELLGLAGTAGRTHDVGPFPVKLLCTRTVTCRGGFIGNVQLS